MGDSIHVEMLGGLSVTVAGIAVLDTSSKINKPWQVFCYLLLNRKSSTAGSKLISIIWPDEDLTDPANVLKNTVYALRREFKRVANLENNPILYENGGYICNPAIKYKIDAEDFANVYDKVKNNTGAERIAVLKKAIVLYKGDLLPQLDEEVWVMTQAVFLKKRFTECMIELCNALYEEGKYNELLATATNASKVDMLEEEYYIYLFRALYALNMHRVLIPTYHKVARIFAEEYGAPVGREITEIYNLSCEKINQIEQDIAIIRDDLREFTHDNNKPLSGPLYCTYDVFKYLYRMVARAAERTGVQIVIMLLTLQMEDGTPISAKILTTYMGRIKNMLMGGVLRRSDTVARYSRTQYAIMLSVENEVNAGVVTKRIEKECAPFLQPNGIKIVIANTRV